MRAEPRGLSSDPEFLFGKVSESRRESNTRVNTGFVSHPEPHTPNSPAFVPVTRRTTEKIHVKDRPHMFPRNVRTRRWMPKVGRLVSVTRRDLVLAPMRGSCPTTLPLGAALVTTAIDLDGHHTRYVRNLGLEFTEPMSFGTCVACGNQFGTDGLRQSPDVAPADRDVGQKSERLGSQLERWEHGPGVDDLGEHRGAVPVGLKFEVGPLGGKSPGDTRGSGPLVLGA